MKNHKSINQNNTTYRFRQSENSKSYSFYKTFIQIPYNFCTTFAQLLHNFYTISHTATVPPELGNSML